MPLDTGHLASEDSVQLDKVCVCVCVCVCVRQRMGKYIQKDPRCEQFPGGWKVRLKFIQGLSQQFFGPVVDIYLMEEMYHHRH